LSIVDRATWRKKAFHGESCFIALYGADSYQPFGANHIYVLARPEQAASETVTVCIPHQIAE
jgi:hypothetical protein